MSKDETTILGTGAVLLQIIDLCRLIKVFANQGGNTRSVIRSNNLTKWLYLVDGGLT